MNFETLKAESSFEKGHMTTNSFVFLSDSLNAAGQGGIDFIENKIGLQIVLEPIQTINKVLGVIPAIGEYAQTFTNSYLTVQGPLEDPDIKVVHLRGFSDTIQGIMEIPQGILKDPDTLSQEIDIYKKENQIEN